MDPTGQNRRTTILIVEDDAPLRHVLALSLRMAGFETVEAGDGLSALALLERTRIDAVVLDLMLPGFDGLVVRDEIAAHPSTRHVPVVIVTASEKPLPSVSPTCVLRKPVDPVRVVATIEKCLRASRRAST